MLTGSLVALLLLGTPAAPKVQTTAPAFTALQSNSEDSSLTMECTGEPGFFEMECRFTKTMLLVKGEAEIKRKLDEAKVNLAKATLGKAELAKACEGLSAREAELKSEGLTPARRLAAAEDHADKKALCECVDRACMTAAVLRLAETELRTCSLYEQSWTTTMKKTGATSWVATEGPKGVCGVVEVFTLEREPDGDYLWSLTWVRATADRKTAPCSSLELHRPIVWSWKTPGDLALKCSRLKFGMF